MCGVFIHKDSDHILVSKWISQVRKPSQRGGITYSSIFLQVIDQPTLPLSDLQGLTGLAGAQRSRGEGLLVSEGWGVDSSL